MKPFEFHLRGKTLVLVDWANVYGWSKKMKWEIDPQKLFHFFERMEEVDRSVFFFGRDKHEKSVDFLKEIQKTGFKVVSKPVKKIPIFIDDSHFWKKLSKAIKDPNILAVLKKEPVLRRKCDFDTEITKEILINLENYDTFILFSGDGDFACVIAEILKAKKRIFVVSEFGSLGKEIQQLGKQKLHPVLVSIKWLKFHLDKKIPG